MTLITPDGDVSNTQELLLSVTETVRDLRRELENLKNQVGAGEEVTATKVKSVATQMAAQIGLCHKLETNLAECRRKQAGIADGADYAIDTDAVRASIRCNLDSLRRCNPAGELPE